MTTPLNNIVHLRWDNHAQSLQSVFQDLYSQQALVDVTLACHGGSIRAHKVVLSAVSPYFRRLFADSASKYPVVILRDVDVATVEGLLRYLYGNEVHVTEDAWQSLCDTAQIFGIAERWFPRPVQVNGASKTRTLGCELVTPKDRCHTRVDEQLEPEKDVCMERQKNQDVDKAAAANQSLPLSKDDYPLSEKESVDGMSNTGDRSEEGDESLSEQEDGHTKEICTSDGQPLAQKMILATKEENAVKKAKHRRKPLKKSNKMVQRVPMDLTKVDSTPRAIAKSDTTPLPESPVPLLIKPEIDMEVKSDDVDERENTDADTLLNGGADAYPFSVLDEQASGSVVVQAVCPFCFKDCKRTAELRAHIRAHTGEKPFRCDICNAPFARSAHLKRHRRVHTGERPFECLRCQKAFSRQDKLKLHMDRHRLRELGGKMTLGRPRKDKPSSPPPTVRNGGPKSTDDSYNSDGDLPCSLASTPTNGSRNTTPLSATVPPNSAELGMGQFAFPGTPASSARPSSSSSPSPLSSGLTSPNSVSGSMPYNEMSYLSLLTLSQRGLGLSANDLSSPSSSSILPHLLQQHHQALQEQALQLYQKGFTASLSKRDPNSLKQQINNSRTRGKGLTTHESAAESLLSLVQQIGEAQTLPPPAHS